MNLEYRCCCCRAYVLFFVCNRYARDEVKQQNNDSNNNNNGKVHFARTCKLESHFKQSINAKRKTFLYEKYKRTIFSRLDNARARDLGSLSLYLSDCIELIENETKWNKNELNAIHEFN